MNLRKHAPLGPCDECGRIRRCRSVDGIGYACIECVPAGDGDGSLDEIGAVHFDEWTVSARRLGREDRAQEREEAREQRGDDSDDQEEDDELQEGSNDDRRPFVYLDEWGGTPQMLLDQLVDDENPRDERDIRVRELPSDPT